MRDFKLFVPAYCVVSETREENEYALKQMEKVLKADIRPAGKLNLEEMKEDVPRMNADRTRV
jgi:hypothetical protein